MAIELIDTIAPKNGGSFPMVNGQDVDVDGVRLPQKLKDIETHMGEIGTATQAEIDALFN